MIILRVIHLSLKYITSKDTAAFVIQHNTPPISHICNIKISQRDKSRAVHWQMYQHVWCV